MAPKGTPKVKTVGNTPKRDELGCQIKTPVSAVKKPIPQNSNKKTPPKEQTKQGGGSIKKKTWQRRPKPAHSGVPMPEKMKKLMAQFGYQAVSGDKLVIADHL